VAIAQQAGVIEIGELTPRSSPASRRPKPLDIPKEAEGKLVELTKEQMDFLKSGETRRIVKPEVMFKRFESLSAKEVANYVAALVSLKEQIDFKPGRDKASIALDTSSPMFNAWTAPPLDPEPQTRTRPDQPWQIYLRLWQRHPHLCQCPRRLTPEDLIVGKVQVAVGAPLDMGSGWRDAKNGPLGVRTSFGAPSAFGNDMYSMINPTQALRIADYGDIAIDNLSTERSVAHVRREVASIARTGAIPIVIGGDHSLEYPNLAAMADVHGKGMVGVVHFDSHYDAGSDRVHLIDHGQPVYRVIHEGHVLGKNYVQVGARAAPTSTHSNGCANRG
jgi:agmatinase